MPLSAGICQPFGMCLWHAQNCESTGLYMCVWRHGGTLIKKKKHKKKFTLRCILTPSSFRPSFHTRCHGDKIKLTLFWAYRKGGERSEQNCLMKTLTHALVHTFHTIPDKLAPMANKEHFKVKVHPSFIVHSLLFTFIL